MRALLLLFVTACTFEHHSVTEAVQYHWDGAPVLCSKVVDDVAHDGLTKVGIDLLYALEHDTAAVLHAHTPMTTVSYEQLDCIFDLATARDVELVTFSDFAARSSPRPALALSFDDEAIDAWYAARDLFTKWNARVTFFVTDYAAWTSEQRTKLAELAALGHDIEAHGMYHLNAVDYVASHSVDDYIQLEVLPAIDLLEQAGFPITTYAFPFGATTNDITAAVLEYVPQVRVTRSACPY